MPDENMVVLELLDNTINLSNSQNDNNIDLDQNSPQYGVRDAAFLFKSCPKTPLIPMILSTKKNLLFLEIFFKNHQFFLI